MWLSNKLRQVSHSSHSCSSDAFSSCKTACSAVASSTSEAVSHPSALPASSLPWKWKKIQSLITTHRYYPFIIKSILTSRFLATMLANGDDLTRPKSLLPVPWIKYWNKIFNNVLVSLSYYINTCRQSSSLLSFCDDKWGRHGRATFLHKILVLIWSCMSKVCILTANEWEWLEQGHFIIKESIMKTQLEFLSKTIHKYKVI